MEEVWFKDEKASHGGTGVTTGEDLLGSNAYVFYTSVKSSTILFLDSIRKLAILNMATCGRFMLMYGKTNTIL